MTMYGTNTSGSLAATGMALGVMQQTLAAMVMFFAGCALCTVAAVLRHRRRDEEENGK